jgi:hypothetical protein
VAVIEGAEAISMGGIVVRNRGQGAEQDFAVGTGAFALDDQTRPSSLYSISSVWVR